MEDDTVEYSVNSTKKNVEVGYADERNARNFGCSSDESV